MQPRRDGGPPEADRSEHGRASSGGARARPCAGHHAELLASAPAGRCGSTSAAPAPPTSRRCSSVRVEDVHLEIGFGGGEHLARRAAERPDVGFIGCEAFVNGTAKLLAQAERAGLDNIRLWDDDAKAVVDWLPQASIARTYLLYPDPWPKRRHRKRRFLGDGHAARGSRGC